MKIYARQIPPEHQESPLMLVDEIYENVICDGNKYYKSRTTDEYDLIMKYIDEVVSEVGNIINKTGCSTYKTITEAIHNYLPPSHKKKYSTKEIATWKSILLCEQQEKNVVICQALELITGKHHSYVCIKGCCQSDWQYIYYPDEECSNEFIQHFEMEYFNTGTEWIVHDGDTEPNSPEDIDGYSLYCYSWNDDGIRKEIAKQGGVNPENVVMYKFEGYTRHATYCVA